MKKIYQGAAETPEESRERRRLESEKAHVTNARLTKIGDIRKHLIFETSYAILTVSVATPRLEGDWCWRVCLQISSSKRNARRSSKKQSANTLEMRYEEVIKPPVSSDDYIDLHETF